VTEIIDLTGNAMLRIAGADCHTPAGLAMTAVSVDAAMTVFFCYSEPVLTLAWESVLFSLLPWERPFVCNSKQLDKPENPVAL